MNFFNRTLVAGLCLATAMSVPATPDAAAVAPVRLLGADVAVVGGRTQVSITVDRAVEARSFLLSGPDRFVVDVPASMAAGSLDPRPAGVVRAVRHARRPDGSMRVVFDLSAAARAHRVEGPDARASRLVYELVGPVASPAMTPSSAQPTQTVSPRTPAARMAAPVVFTRPATPAPAASNPAAPTVDRPGQRVIVIDAGHGGHDPGALGRSGLREKDVVLAAAEALRDQLQARGGYRVVLTRDDDTYVDHEDRVAIGRREKADLFISLHADAHSNPTARGASVYTLSASGETRARNMMGRQDWTVDLGDAPKDERVQSILVNLTQRETTSRSAEFAQKLIGELGREAPLLRNTHRSAGFFVLLAPDVPAVLLELGFLTNDRDEARLADAAARRRAMAAVADSIDVYFARSRAYAGR